MSKFHITETQLQTWVTSKKISDCLEEKNWLYLKKEKLRCDWFIWPDIQAGVYKAHGDQSITQLWKKNILPTRLFLCKFSAKKLIYFWSNVCCALFVWSSYFLWSLSSANCFVQINIWHIYSPRCWVILWHPQILKVFLTYMHVHDTHYFAALNSHYPFSGFFDFCILSLPARGISHFLTLSFSACVPLFSESLKHARKGLVCRSHFPAFVRGVYTVPLHELPLPEQQLRNTSSRAPLLSYGCLLTVLKIGICKI